MRPTFVGSVEASSAIELPIKTIDLRILGEPCTIKFLMDDAILANQFEVEHLIEVLTRHFQNALVDKFKREMERVNGRS